MSNPYPKKRYIYICKCGKDPMRGTIQTDPKSEREIFDNVLDIAWTESHYRPGCSLKSKIVSEIKPRTKT